MELTRSGYKSGEIASMLFPNFLATSMPIADAMFPMLPMSAPVASGASFTWQV